MKDKQINLYEKRDMGQVLNTTVRFIRENKKQLFKIVGLMVLPLVLMSSTFNSLNYSKPANPEMQRYMWDHFLTMKYFLSLVTGYLAYICLCWGVSYFLILYRSKGKNNFDVNDVWGLVFRHGWKLTVVFFVYLVIYSAIIMIPTAISLIANGTPSPYLLIPAFIFAVPLLMLPVAYLTDEEGILHSIERVMALLKGNWLSGFGLLASCIALFGVWILLPSAMLQVMMFDFRNKTLNLSMNLNLLIILNNVFQLATVLVYFFVQLAMAIFYYSLSEEKDHITLNEKINLIGLEEEAAHV